MFSATVGATTSENLNYTENPVKKILYTNKGFFEQRKMFCAFLEEKHWDRIEIFEKKDILKDIIDSFEGRLSSHTRLAVGLKTQAKKVNVLRKKTPTRKLPDDIEEVWKKVFTDFSYLASDTHQNDEYFDKNLKIFVELYSLGEYIQALGLIEKELFIGRQRKLLLENKVSDKENTYYTLCLECYLEIASKINKPGFIVGLGQSVANAARRLSDLGCLSPSLALSLIAFSMNLIDSKENICAREVKINSVVALKLWNLAVNNVSSEWISENKHILEKISSTIRKAESRIKDVWVHYQLTLPKNMKPIKLLLPPNISNLWTVISPNDSLEWAKDLSLKDLDYPEIAEDIERFREGCLNQATIYHRLPKGGNLLLCGPEGCGKTVMLRKLCQSLNKTVIEVVVSKLMGPEFGQSQKNIENLFLFASSQAMYDKQSVVILIEKAELFFYPREKSHGNDEDQRNVATFLSCISGLQPGMEKDFHIVASTKNPDLLDSAILSRFGTILKLPVPSDSIIEHVLKTTLPKDLFTINQMPTIKVIAFAASGLNLNTVVSVCGNTIDRIERKTNNQSENSWELFNEIINMQVVKNIRNVEILKDSVSEFSVDVVFRDVVKNLFNSDSEQISMSTTFRAIGRIWMVLIYNTGNAKTPESTPESLPGYTIVVLDGSENVEFDNLNARLIKRNRELGPLDSLPEIYPVRHLISPICENQLIQFAGWWNDLGTSCEDLSNISSEWLHQDGSLVMRLELRC